MPKKASTTNYTAIPYGTEEAELSLPAALLQAAQALDIAAEQAVECRDTETLLSVAALWMKMAEHMIVPHDHEDHADHRDDAQPVGFIQYHKEKEMEIVRDS